MTPSGIEPATCRFVAFEKSKVSVISTHTFNLSFFVNLYEDRKIIVVLEHIQTFSAEGGNKPFLRNVGKNAVFRHHQRIKLMFLIQI